MIPRVIVPFMKPVCATVTIPGSKSYSNRSLLVASLTDNPVKIKNALESDDIDAMIGCLMTLGIKVTKQRNEINVIGNIWDVEESEYKLNADLSGTTIRFILALCCITPGIKILQGKEGLNKRPIKDLVDVLRQLGIQIEYLAQEGFPPLKIASSKIKHRNLYLNGGVSSQFLSALLMVAPVIGNLTITVVGKQISRSYVDMTIGLMEQFGVKIQNTDYQKYKIFGNQKYNINTYNVEGDYSGAGYFAAIAALTNSSITLKNLDSNSIQGDKEFFGILEHMGNQIITGRNEVTVVGKGIKPMDVNMENCPDQAQTLAVLAAFANGVTTIKGVRSLRVKETERVQALEQELLKMGIKTKSDNDTLIIYGGSPKPATINTHGDHRMAMSFAVAGTRLGGMVINNPEVVSKTFPEFWEKLSGIYL